MPALSKRQRNILDGFADGLRLVQIARELHVADSTLKVHVRKLYDLLQVETAAGAVDRAYRLGYLTRDRAPGTAASALTDAELLAELGRRTLGPGLVVQITTGE